MRYLLESLLGGSTMRYLLSNLFSSIIMLYGLFRLFSNFIRIIFFKKGVKKYLITDLISGSFYFWTLILLFGLTFYKLPYMGLHLLSYFAAVIIFIIMKGKNNPKILRYILLAVVLVNFANVFYFSFSYYAYFIIYQFIIIYLAVKKDKSNNKLENYMYMTLSFNDFMNISVFSSLILRMMANGVI